LKDSTSNQQLASGQKPEARSQQQYRNYKPLIMQRPARSKWQAARSKNMKTKAIRLYGKDDLRLEEFELPAIKDDEILASVVSDSICMSSYKAAHQGTDHKRIPNDVAENPIIIGHEF
jgi:hypothetical protein